MTVIHFNVFVCINHQLRFSLMVFLKKNLKICNYVELSYYQSGQN